MKPAPLLAALAASALALSHSAGAGPELKLPDFSHLRKIATDSSDITIDGFLLKIAKHFTKDDDDEDLRILQDIKSVRVRNFEFDSDGAYSVADVDSVRQQLSAPGWSRLVQSHKREPREDVDVFINTDDGKILGIAVIASDPRSFTIVNIVGNIDMEKFAKMEGQFGIPKVSPTE